MLYTLSTVISAVIIGLVFDDFRFLFTLVDTIFISDTLYSFWSALINVSFVPTSTFI